MKQYLLILQMASAACCLPSCSNDHADDDLTPTSVIRFHPYLQQEESGRGIQTDEIVLQSNGFGVMGYLHPLGSTPDYTAPDFMNGQHVSYAGSGWTYSPVKYWPANSTDRIDFLAYAPYGDSHLTVSGNTLTFTVDSDPALQTDLVVAAPVKNASYAGNAAGIAFSFSHLLARLQFTARCTDATNDLCITSITLKVNSHSKGTVDLAAATPALTGSGTATELSYTLTNGTHFSHTAIAPLTEEPTALNEAGKGSLLLFPTANAPTLEIHYTREGTNYTASTILAASTLQAGKSTTVNLKVTPPASTP